jgi:hypothetical protein
MGGERQHVTNPHVAVYRRTHIINIITTSTNRLEVIILAGGEFRKGSTLATKVLGFAEEQLASSTLAGPHWQPLPASKANPIMAASAALRCGRGLLLDKTIYRTIH